MCMVIPFGCVYLGTGSVHPSPSGRSPEGVARLYLGTIRPHTRLQIQYVKGRLVGHPLGCVSALRLLLTLRQHKGMTCQPTSLLIRWCNCARRRRSALRPLCNWNFRKLLCLLYLATRRDSSSDTQPLCCVLGALGRPLLVLPAFLPIVGRTRLTTLFLAM